MNLETKLPAAGKTNAQPNPTVNSIRLVKEDIAFIAMLLGVAAFLLLYRLGDIATVSLDEAAFAMLAKEIQDGFRPLHGYFSIYTSPIHTYIIAGFFHWLGDSTLSLRLSGVVFNLLAVALYIDLLRRISKRVSWVATCVLLTSPTFVVQARMAGENYALNPFLMLLGCWLYQVWGMQGSSSARRKLGQFAAGIAWGLLAWNHLITVPSLLAMMVAYLFYVRPSWSEFWPRLLWVASGFFLALVTDIYLLANAHLGSAISATMNTFTRAAFASAGLNFLYTLGGDSLFTRICGETLLSFLWLIPGSLALSSVWMLYSRDWRGPDRLWIAILLFIALSFIGIWLILPEDRLGSRHWLLPIWLIPVLIAINLDSLPRLAHFFVSASIILGGLASVGLNYFACYSVRGGEANASLDVGGRTDNSMPEIRPTIEKLSHYSDAPIYTEEFDSIRLQYLLPSAQRARAHTIDEIRQGAPFPNHSLFVLMNSPARNLYGPVRIISDYAFRREQLSDHAFIVFEIIK